MTSEILTLPSGSEIDLKRPNFSLCKTREDFIELQCALQEKIIEIELQIDTYLDTHDAGQPTGGWMPKAKAALKWTKLYRDECAKRGGLLNDKIKSDRAAADEQRFRSVAKEILPPEVFKSICKACGQLAHEEAA